MKKIISILLVVAAVIFSFCGCTKKINDVDQPKNPEKANAKESTLTLAYASSEALDPFTVETVINIQLMPLVYDGLYKIDKSYKPIPLIAKSGIVSGTTVNITLDSSVFSDGTAVTPADVAYSFDRAKQSPAYKTKLANVESVNITAGNMLMFHLVNPDPYILSCFTFPIVKNASLGVMPIGSGRYVFQQSGESRYLIVNTKKSGFNPTVKTITLQPMRGDVSLESSLEIGNIGLYFDDISDGSFSRINAKTVDMGINNFVYLGINNESSLLSNASVRKAVSLVIDRSEIANTAFQGHAREAYSPFNPDWYALASKDLIISRNAEKAAELIKESNVDISEKEISILVNKENPFKLAAAQFIETQLRILGFDVKLKDYDIEYYKEALEIGSYDLYIGEFKLTPDMDLNPIFSGSLNIGLNPESESSARYQQLLNGECELMDFINTFNEDLPFIPLCYRNACVSYTNSTDADYACCDGDVFYDIETWRYK